MGETSIRIAVEGMDAEDLEEALRHGVGGSDEIRFADGAIAEEQRSLSTDVIVAIIESGTTILTAVMTQLFALAQARKSGRIIIYTRGGQRIEIPADAANEQTIEVRDDLPPAEEIVQVQVAGQAVGA
jgi:hypothetical protein